MVETALDFSGSRFDFFRGPAVALEEVSILNDVYGYTCGPSP